MGAAKGSQIIEAWPDESREAAQPVIGRYGEPQEATESLLTWHRPGPWKRIVASRTFYRHSFPAPHIDAVESFIDYRLPPEIVTPLAQFDGSVVVERTAGELWAPLPRRGGQLPGPQPRPRHRDGREDGRAARQYYTKEFLDYRRKKPTPYMEGLRIPPQDPQATPDPDTRVLSDADLEQAASER